ncbi:MipA/OmpV family protein [Sphingomonas endolithica]|uniref:MipA/OmpV family protein n=1 Tax=Sphingomonas endolithica TaxID=2972485 RepID=UPI0021AF2082|nr:MipA/OmpV family protein [Sphingomonas sp. ZFBP2030]
MLLSLAAGPLALALFITNPPAAAAQAESDTSTSRRTRLALGPQIVPSFPGADGISIRPLVDVARARGDEPFAFEAPDESFGPSLVRTGGLRFGPALGFEGKRSRDNTNGMLPKVGFTFELGGFVQYQLTPKLRLRTEVRQGIGGHKGLIGTVGADYVTRDADRWLFSIGPRVTLANGRYNRAFFGIDRATAMTTTLPAFRADGGLQAVGVTAGLIRQINARWGIYSYAKYDRLVADPGRSPVVRAFGARNQLSGGIALSYTFGGSVRKKAAP